MDAITMPMLVTAIGVFGVLAAFFGTRAAAAKAQNDQFHARINKGVEDQHATELKVAKLEGVNEGIQIGRNQIVQELGLVGNDE